MHQLKKGQEAFTVVEGPLKGRTFVPGVAYVDIPPGDAGRFTAVKAADPPIETEKVKTEKKSA